MRRDAGKKLLRALLIVVAAFALAIFVPMAVIRWQIAAAERSSADAVANFSSLKAPELKKNHELKAVDVAQKINVRKIKDAVKFVPEISPDEDVEAQLILGTDDAGTTDGTHALVSVPDSSLLTDAPTDANDPGISSKYPTPIEVVEQMPQFPGGLKALMQWLTAHVVYPPMCIRDNVQGRVEVSFIVDRNGNVKDPKIIKKVHPLLDREALLTVRRMPKWVPGRVKGRVSVVRVTIPIVFSL